MRYLNAKISRDRLRGFITLSQPTHVDDLLSKHGLLDAKGRDIPMTVGADVGGMRDDDYPADKTKYAESVGALLYIASFTRPDLAYAVNSLARHMSNPAERHFKLLKGVIRYLSKTRTLGITFGDTKSFDHGSSPVIVYTDSDFAGCKDTRRSRTGYVLMLYGGPVSWTSKLQSVVATSTAESEYIACAAAAREAVWFRRVCSDLDIPLSGAIPVRVDNQAAISMGNSSADTARTKHIDISYHFLRDQITRQRLRLVYVRTDNNPADIFTKALPEAKFGVFRQMMGMRPIT